MSRDCGLLVRWWHRQLRNSDRDNLVPALRRLGTKSRFVETFSDAWVIFTEMPGNEHWRCSCGIGQSADDREGTWGW